MLCASVALADACCLLSSTIAWLELERLSASYQLVSQERLVANIGMTWGFGFDFNDGMALSRNQFEEIFL